jgi:hypothetical protein
VFDNRHGLGLWASALAISDLCIEQGFLIRSSGFEYDAGGGI